MNESSSGRSSWLRKPVGGGKSLPSDSSTLGKAASEGVKEGQQSDHDEEEHHGIASGFDGVPDVPGVEGQ